MSNNLTPERIAEMVAELRKLSAFWIRERELGGRHNALASWCAKLCEMYQTAADALEAEEGKDARIAELEADKALKYQADSDLLHWLMADGTGHEARVAWLMRIWERRWDKNAGGFLAYCRKKFTERAV